MASISKALVAGGLVLMTGPLCFQVQAQDYVDVEAERRAASNGTAPATSTPAPASTTPAPADPYGARPTQSYPATSYGLDRAPASPAAVAPTSAAPTPTAGGQGQNLGNLFLQLQQLQQDVMRLNGIVEEQANELRKLKEQSLERYVDLDRRLSAAGSGAAAASAGSGSAGAAPSGGQSLGRSNVAEQPGEGEAYRAAYALVRSQQFDQAVDAFNQFLRNYPDGKYAPNAHYWLGELYLVVQPADLESSRQAFTLLLDQYPNNNKAADAMYKLGKVYYMKGNRERAREYFDRVIRDYGNSNSSAVKLSRDFIDQNY